jgi:hypothetical protein
MVLDEDRRSTKCDRLQFATSEEPVYRARWPGGSQRERPIARHLAIFLPVNCQVGLKELTRVEEESAWVAALVCQPHNSLSEGRIR